MKHETLLLINDIERMSESLQKLLYVTENNPDIPHEHTMMLEGIEQIREGTQKVVQSLINV